MLLTNEARAAFDSSQSVLTQGRGGSGPFDGNIDGKAGDRDACGSLSECMFTVLLVPSPHRVTGRKGA